MGTVKVSFTIQEGVVRELREVVDERKRSAFVSEAIMEKIEQMKRQPLREELIEGYQERRYEDAEINTEWEEVTIESWDPG